MPDWSDSMNDVAGSQAVAAGDLCVTGAASIKLTALIQRRLKELIVDGGLSAMP